MVGLGGHAYRNVLPTLHYLPVHLAALCDVNADLLARTTEEYATATAYPDAATMFEQAALDAVLLCTGPRFHPELAIAAVLSGLHVWMEKPPALRAAEVEAMIAVRGDRVCAIGFKKAYMPAARKARELLAEPAFGPLRSMLGVYPVTIPRDGRAVLESGVSPQFLEVGSHPLSLMRYLGGAVEAVTTLRGPGEEAVGSVTLHFVNGAQGVLFLAGGSPALHAGERYDLFGNGQIISIENSVRVAWHRGVPFTYETQTDFTAPGIDSGTVLWESSNRQGTLENTSLFIQGMYAELLDFCQAVFAHRQPEIGTLELALDIMRIYEAAMLSDGVPWPVNGPAA
jgi:predicted dehydrogenase